MLSAFGERQQQLFSLLFSNKLGMTVDELARALAITRTAVNQHLAALERDGFVQRVDMQITGGRPGQIYALTQRGYDLFPKQYSWFSSLMLQTMKDEIGSDGLVRYLRKIAAQVGVRLQPNLPSEASEAERIKEVTDIMNKLAYQISLSKSDNHPDEFQLEARNCVYHDLASKFPEVCQFDLQLLAELMQLDPSQVRLDECIVRGGNVCKFRFLKKALDP